MLTKLKSLWRYFTRKKPDGQGPQIPPRPEDIPPQDRSPFLDDLRDEINDENKKPVEPVEIPPKQKEDISQYWSFLDGEASNPIQFSLRIPGDTYAWQFFYWVEQKALGFESKVDTVDNAGVNSEFMAGEEYKYEPQSRFIIIRDPKEIENEDLLRVWNGTELYRKYYDAQYDGKAAEFLEMVVDAVEKRERYVQPEANLIEFSVVRDRYNVVGNEPEDTEPETEGQESNDE